MNTKYYIVSLCLLLSSLSSFGGKKCKLCRISTPKATAKQSHRTQARNNQPVQSQKQENESKEEQAIPSDSCE